MNNEQKLEDFLEDRKLEDEYKLELLYGMNLKLFPQVTDNLEANQAFWSEVNAMDKLSIIRYIRFACTLTERKFHDEFAQDQSYVENKGADPKWVAQMQTMNIGELTSLIANLNGVIYVDQLEKQIKGNDNAKNSD